MCLPPCGETFPREENWGDVSTRTRTESLPTGGKDITAVPIQALGIRQLPLFRNPTYAIQVNPLSPRESVTESHKAAPSPNLPQVRKDTLIPPHGGERKSCYLGLQLKPRAPQREPYAVGDFFHGRVPWLCPWGSKLHLQASSYLARPNFTPQLLTFHLHSCVKPNPGKQLLLPQNPHLIPQANLCIRNPLPIKVLAF